ncbi:uncharacterized protein LOC119991429 [Tripterygium wilfordii]|uniref:uncharacterized protein LOC119991429 n=1 Tax=Tripterygium wilfordii TaxID=458696 RepID=UPI0018F82BC5|nr:uncharacterized protein LOC119991429 [Tripterygium wilfordii]
MPLVNSHMIPSVSLTLAVYIYIYIWISCTRKRQDKVNHHIENFRLPKPLSISTSEEMASLASHTRSNSLPSRPHPFTSEFEDHLRRLRASESEAFSSSTSSISHQLSGLQDLHDCVNKLLLLPLTQQSLSQHQREGCVDELLDGSLRLLDVWSTAKDALLQTKESTLALQSVLRRSHGGEIRDIKEYLASRKAVRKAISKAFGNLKRKESKSSFLINKDQESSIAMLIEVEAVSLKVFESLLSFISGTKTSKLGGWSLVSKIVKPKRIECEENQRKTNEFVDVDAALCIFVGRKASKFEDIGKVQNQLKSLELCVQDLEEGLDSLCRHLIKTRVSLLNILNH